MLVGMSRHRDVNPRWVLVDANAVAKVEDGEVTGLLIYGHVTSARLREINLGRLDAVNFGVLTEWRRVNPPSPKEVADASATWERARKAAKGKSIEELAREFVAEQAQRRPGESEDEYLRRFATVFMSVASTTKSPNKTMADGLGYSPNTIKAYILKARKLGYIPPTNRSAR